MRKILLICLLIGLMGFNQIPENSDTENIFFEESIQIINLPITNNTYSNITGDNNMVKILDAVDTTIDIPNNQYNNPHDILFDGTYYFVVDVSCNIYRWDINWSNRTKVYSGDLINGIPSIYYFNSTYYVLFSLHYEVSYPLYRKRIYQVTSSTAGGGDGTWTSSLLYSEDVASSTDEPYYVQLIYSQTKLWYIYLAVTATYATNTLKITDWTDTYTLSLSGRCTAMWGDSDYIWFMYYTTSDSKYNIYKWDSVGGFVIDSQPSLSGFGDINTNYSQYWRVGTSQYIIWKDKFYYWHNSIDGWILIGNLDSDYPVPHWEISSGNYVINAVTYANYFIEVYSSKVAIYKLSITLNPIFAWGLYIGESTNLYLITSASTSTLYSGGGKYYIEDYARAWIETSDKPIDDGAVKIYTDAGTLVMRGLYQNGNNNDSAPYSVEVHAFLKMDLEKLIDYDSSIAETIGTAITNIITANCDYASVGTFNVSASTHTFKIRGTPFKDVLTDLTHMDGRIWYSDMLDQLYIDVGTVDSGVDILSADGNVPASIEPDVLIRKVGTIEVRGQDGAYYKISTNAGNGYISDVKPDMNQSQIEAWATSTIAKNQIKVQQYVLNDVPTIGFFTVGQQVTLEQNISPYSITSAQFYTKELWFDFISERVIKLIVHDVLHYSIKQMALSPEKVEAHAQYIESTVIDLGKYHEIDADGDFKNQHADQWGTSGTPIGWTMIADTDTFEIVSSFQSHLYPIHCIGDVDEGFYKTITSVATLYYSVWISPTATNKRITFGLYDSGGSIRAGFNLNTSGNLQIYTSSGTYTTIQTYVANTWYHVMIDYNATRALYYINGVYAGTNTTTTAANITDIKIITRTNDCELYYDASYNGTSKAEAMSSWKDGMLVSKGVYTESIIADKIITVDPISAQDTATKNYVDVLMGIGSTNAQYMPCMFALESAVGKITTNLGTFENVDGTDINLTYLIPLEPTRGTLHLHVVGLKISLTDADVNNYITDIRLRATTDADPPIDSALVTDTTDYNSADVFTTAITDTDLSSYVHYMLRVDCVVDTAAALNIAGIWIKYYYA